MFCRFFSSPTVAIRTFTWANGRIQGRSIAHELGVLVHLPIITDASYTQPFQKVVLRSKHRAFIADSSGQKIHTYRIKIVLYLPTNKYLTNPMESELIL